MNVRTYNCLNGKIQVWCMYAMPYAICNANITHYCRSTFTKGQEIKPSCISKFVSYKYQHYWLELHRYDFFTDIPIADINKMLKPINTADPI